MEPFVVLLMMRKGVVNEVYDDFIGKWVKMNSNMETMQSWVDDVRTFIGSTKYEEIKAQYIKKEKDREDLEASMNCTLPFRRYRSSVKFKRDIGADARIDEDLASFKGAFENVLNGVYGTE